MSFGFISKLAADATGLYYSAGEAVSGAAHTIGDVASSSYHGAVNLANTASGYVQRAEHGVTRGLHAAEDWVDQGSHALAGHVADVPGLGFIARGLADQATQTAQFAGGMVGGATTMVGGIFNAALHPIDTMAGVEAMVEHTPMPLGKMARGAHDLIDVARGRQTVTGMINRAVNPLATMQEDEEFWGRMGSAVIDPYRQSIKEGRYGEAVGRGVFDIGSMLLGVGEVGEAARGVGVAGDVARAGEVADAGRVAGAAGETTRTLGVTSDATRIAETTANTTGPAAATAEARTAGEGSLSTRAESHIARPETEVGLSDRGYRPNPGERTETRQQYRERRSLERAEATAAKADQPLEPSLAGEARHGHSYSRHGAHTAPAQGNRVLSGHYPDQHPGQVPGGEPAKRASYFGSPHAHAEALGRGRRELQRALKSGEIPTHPDPVTGKPTYVKPTGLPERHRPAVPTNRPEGYGSSLVPLRQPPPSTSFVLDAAGNRIPVQSPTPLPIARVVHEYVPSAGEWRTVTAYPEPLPLPNGQTNLR